MTIAARLAALERTKRASIGPYQKEPPPPEWWAAVEQAYHDWQADRAARLAAFDLPLLNDEVPR